MSAAVVTPAATAATQISPRKSDDAMGTSGVLGRREGGKFRLEHAKSWRLAIDYRVSHALKLRVAKKIVSPGKKIEGVVEGFEEQDAVEFLVAEALAGHLGRLTR